MWAQERFVIVVSLAPDPSGQQKPKGALKEARVLGVWAQVRFVYNTPIALSTDTTEESPGGGTCVLRTRVWDTVQHSK